MTDPVRSQDEVSRNERSENEVSPSELSETGIPGEEYHGPGTLRLGEDVSVAVELRMSARFEPVEGRFRWAGRTTPDPLLRERVSGGLHEAKLSLPGHGETPVRLSEPDPWGGVRLSGTGTPPWF